MSRSTAALLALSGLFALARPAQAQYIVGGRPASVATAFAPSPPVAVTAPVAATTAAHPYTYYSYYAAYPAPARGYVGYGPQDNFNYYGRAYGYPYDKWTWPYMTGSYQASLARYYEPPVK